ncbi:hypothetical protein Syun_006185 [Stephania yunnanensis]|uniref:Glycosyltransferase n=1 Tax=Stephania yunnanensis TaxID=152371 RepID=A0AAP0KXS3_9MAGN
MASHNSHCVVITFPLQSHINPALQFAKHLANSGASVTFLLAVSAHRRISNNTSTNLINTSSQITFLPFSDGYDDGIKSGDDGKNFMSEFKKRATEALTDLIRTSEEESCPVTCLVYTLLLPWAAEVATSLGVSSALLWIQPALVFDLYYYYFNGFKDEIMKVVNNDVDAVELPGLPCKLTCTDFPSFFVPSNAYSAVSLAIFEEQFKILKSTATATAAAAPPRVLVNTFDELEPEALKALQGSVELIAIGPLVPSAYLGGKDSSDTCFGGDMFESSQQKCTKWLNTKAKNSVVYVSFGSLIVLKRRQVEEIARGLLDTGRPFLWVLRRVSPTPDSNVPSDADEEHVRRLIDEINNRGDDDQQGLIVEWCSQVEVLSHNSIGCFVSHCGWNSTLEGLVVGVPMVAFPQWTDQGTNAKLIEEAWGTGVRVIKRSLVVEVKKDGGGEDGKEEIVESEEVKRCVEIVMGEGERGEEIKRNVEKWRGLARKAVQDGGSSERNLVALLQEMGRD